METPCKYAFPHEIIPTFEEINFESYFPMLDILLLQAAQPNPIVSFLPLIGIVVVFYFFFMRPQQKKQKAQTQFNSNLSKGDEVVTASGMIGKINKIEGNTITLQVDQKTFIKVLRSAVSKEMTDNLTGVAKS